MPSFNFTFTLESFGKLAVIFLDIFIVWLIIYYVLRIVRNNSRTIQIFKGILFVLIVDALSKFLGLKTLEYFADMFINWGFLALIIIFQPELRSILERMGKSNVFNRIVTLSGNEKEHLVDQIVTAVMLLSKDKTGALISIERGQSLEDYIATGTRLNSDVTAELLTSIFVTTTPLHDGAVIIQGDKIACASAYFPPTNLDLPGRYGARHRAAVGISEVSDAVTIVVSEETGNISVTEEGHIYHVSEKELRDYLLRVICDESTEVTSRKKKAPSRPSSEGFMSKLTLKHQPAKQEDVREEKMEELEEEVSRIKLPQNHKHDRPVPSYPSQKKKPSAMQRVTPVSVSQPKEENTVTEETEPVKRMTSEEVAAARRATVEKLKHTSSDSLKKEDLKEEEKKFDTSKIDISKIVGFDSELNNTFDMVDNLDELPAKKKTGGDQK